MKVRKKNDIVLNFKKGDIVKIHRKFESFPLAYLLISRRNRKYLPYFAYGNKPNITSTYRVIESKSHYDGESTYEICIVQNTKTEQVYIITGESLYLKHPCCRNTTTIDDLC